MYTRCRKQPTATMPDDADAARGRPDRGRRRRGPMNRSGRSGPSGRASWHLAPKEPADRRQFLAGHAHDATNSRHASPVIAFAGPIGLVVRRFRSRRTGTLSRAPPAAIARSRHPDCRSVEARTGAMPFAHGNPNGPETTDRHRGKALTPAIPVENGRDRRYNRPHPWRHPRESG